MVFKISRLKDLPRFLMGFEFVGLGPWLRGCRAFRAQHDRDEPRSLGSDVCPPSVSKEAFAGYSCIRFKDEILACWNQQACSREAERRS